MTEPADDPVVAYLKNAGLYGTFAVAAGVAAKVEKDATVSDVHVSTTPGQDGKGKKPPTTVGQGAKPAEAAPAGGDVAKAEEIEINKRALAGGDLVFSKGDANLYVSRPLTEGSAKRLVAWAEEQGIPNIVPANLMHVTQVHSKAEVDTGKLKPLSTLIDIGDVRWLSQLGKGNALVMFFDSPDMQRRFQEAVAAGASWDFPTYMPHVTISYDTGDVDAHMFGMLRAPDMPLQLGPEVFAASNDKWVEDNALVTVDDADWSVNVAVSKAEPDKQMVFGWASISTVNGQLVIDKQGDMIPVDEIEKAAYDFTLYAREHGTMHALRDTGKLIESCVFTPEKAALGITAKNDKGEALMGWWVGFKITDPDVWKAHREGDFPEFSIGGRATHVDVA